VVIRGINGSNEPTIVNTLGRGVHFGERALIGGVVRAASIVAKTKLSVLRIGRHEFTSLLGPLKKLMERDVQKDNQEAEEFTKKRAALERKVEAIRVDVEQRPKMRKLFRSRSLAFLQNQFNKTNTNARRAIMSNKAEETRVCK
jgi:CRP-like cAMP-binding protein